METSDSSPSKTSRTSQSQPENPQYHQLPDIRCPGQCSICDFYHRVREECKRWLPENAMSIDDGSSDEAVTKYDTEACRVALSVKTMERLIKAIVDYSDDCCLKLALEALQGVCDSREILLDEMESVLRSVRQWHKRRRELNGIIERDKAMDTMREAADFQMREDTIFSETKKKFEDLLHKYGNPGR